MLLRVATYNIRKCVGLDWRRSPDRTLRVVVETGADVVALQEADKRLAPRHAALPPAMIAAHSPYRIVPLSAAGTSLGWHGNALLVREGLEPVDVHRIDLPGLEPRGAVAVDLQGPGGMVRIVAVHLGLRRGDRLGQIGRIRHWLDGQASHPTVMMGDFNDWSPVGRIDAHLPGFQVLAPGRSFHASLPVAALDRIAVSEGVAVTGQGVVQGGEARMASDHLPVWADLRFAPGAEGRRSAAKE